MQVIKRDDTDYRNGKLTVEGGGLLTARSLFVNSDALVVDVNGHITLDSKGNIGGEGAGYGKQFALPLIVG